MQQFNNASWSSSFPSPFPRCHSRTSLFVPSFLYESYRIARSSLQMSPVNRKSVIQCVLSNRAWDCLRMIDIYIPCKQAIARSCSDLHNTRLNEIYQSICLIKATTSTWIRYFLSLQIIDLPSISDFYHSPSRSKSSYFKIFVLYI